jgi:hypothetical protein
MRKFYWLLTTIFIVSCSADKDNQAALYQSYGVIKEDANTSGKLYVRSDNGKAIVPTLSNILSNEDKDSRVWMLFDTNDDVNSDTVKANIHELLKITQIIFRSQSDESVSDNVYLQDIWVAQGYLTLIMNVAASSENSLGKHKYTMYSDMEIVNDTISMEFKYDRDNDGDNLKFTKIVTLKLDDRINPDHDSNSIVLAIRYLTNMGFRETFVTYKR